jgi:hypothetical protein
MPIELYGEQCEKALWKPMETYKQLGYTVYDNGVLLKERYCEIVDYILSTIHNDETCVLKNPNYKHFVNQLLYFARVFMYLPPIELETCMAYITKNITDDKKDTSNNDDANPWAHLCNDCLRYGYDSIPDDKCDCKYCEQTITLNNVKIRVCKYLKDIRKKYQNELSNNEKFVFEFNPNHPYTNAIMIDNVCMDVKLQLLKRMSYVNEL